MTSLEHDGYIQNVKLLPSSQLMREIQEYRDTWLRQAPQRAAGATRFWYQQVYLICRADLRVVAFAECLCTSHSELLTVAAAMTCAAPCCSSLAHSPLFYPSMPTALLWAIVVDVRRGAWSIDSRRQNHTPVRAAAAAAAAAASGPHQW